MFVKNKNDRRERVDQGLAVQVGGSPSCVGMRRYAEFGCGGQFTVIRMSQRRGVNCATRNLSNFCVLRSAKFLNSTSC